VLPPLIEFDVIYFYIMEASDDASGHLGEIRTSDILNVAIKDMSKSKTEEGHAFIIDTGKKMFHLNASHRFDLERWIDSCWKRRCAWGGIADVCGWTPRE
jgi:hypothetical protein